MDSQLLIDAALWAAGLIIGLIIVSLPTKQERESKRK